MKLRGKIFIIHVACIFLSLPLHAAKDTTNIALQAIVSTSHVSAWETLGAVNDGNQPSSSSDNSKGAYGNWAGEDMYNSYNWVQYSWDSIQEVISTQVFWWDDGGGIDQPTHAYIEYWDGGEWVNAGDIGTELNKYNSFDLKVFTNMVRISMKSNFATGILEWEVKGMGCSIVPLTCYVQVNDEAVTTADLVRANVGDSVTFSAEPANEGIWQWTGPNSFSSSAASLCIHDVQEDMAGTYIVEYIDECGNIAQAFCNLDISSDFENGSFTWPSYNPALNYNFKNEYPNLEMPTQDLDDCPEVVGTISDRWWTFKWGPDANSLVSEDAIYPLLDRMNEEFAYFRDSLGWPPDKRAKNGYRSAVYLYGSGLCTDNASNTDKGGWQGSIFYEGESWPMVLLSYYPVYSFDPACTYSDKNFQTGAVVHEGIHAILADLPGCRDAAWFHEGGNTWLQQEAESRRKNDFSSVGFLNGAALLAPFMPIECYSGWLQDGSFGGPSAEGVNMFNGGTQICTWRNYLGGTQYGNTFAIFMGETVSQGSIAWVWQNAESRVLEGISEGLGDVQTRRLIMEYRAKQALLDIGKWSSACRKVLNDNFGISIKSEWTPTWKNPEVWKGSPYAKSTVDSTGLLTPEYRTTPGWSGANQIPLIVEGDRVKIDFQPIGNNMSCQLCYRSVDGTTVYSIPVTEGECSLNLDLEPANDVVFAVICNTDYIYEGEQTRTAHFDYRLKLGEGVKETGHSDVRWYQWDKSLQNKYDPEPVSIKTNYNSKLSVFPNPISENQVLQIELDNPTKEYTQLKIFDISGKEVTSYSFQNTLQIYPEELPGKGSYILSFQNKNIVENFKLILQ